MTDLRTIVEGYGKCGCPKCFAFALDYYRTAADEDEIERMETGVTEDLAKVWREIETLERELVMMQQLKDENRIDEKIIDKSVKRINENLDWCRRAVKVLGEHGALLQLLSEAR